MRSRSLDRRTSEAESILREARLAASQEALKLREQTEQPRRPPRRTRGTGAPAGRARERSSTPSSSELSIREEPQPGQSRVAQRKEVLGSWRARNSLPLDADRNERNCNASPALSQAEARETLLSGVEQEALKDANTLSRHILERPRPGRRKRPATSSASPSSATPASTPSKPPLPPSLACQRRHQGPHHRPRGPQHPRL